MSVVFETTIGDFTIDLYTEERPQTCCNFLKLCKIKYYNWNLFFTVQSNFIAQTGDPTGTGKGGESVYGVVLGEQARYYEAEKLPKIKHDRPGLVSMVNCGDKMLGSQFLITLGSDLKSLDGEHCVFGEIAEGLEIILKLNEIICDTDHRPYQDIRISHTVILEDPFDDPQGLEIPDRSPGPTAEVLQSDRIGADEDINDTAGLTAVEIEEMQKAKEAKARATILEIVGDIPDADMAPPENVLFVCKLNPVTNDDDLEIIFSRFGEIKSCEVIRDKQTGDSLQYAFIEFSEQKSCEEAYFKMDNVLIDDRRIHVDFSQSVAKMRWRGKGRGVQHFDDNGREINNGKGKPRDRRSESPRKDKKYEKNRDRRQRSRSREKVRDRSRERKQRSRSREKVRERSRDRKERSRSREKIMERSKDRKERSRSREKVIERSKDRKERSRSRERTRDRKEKRDRSRSKDGRRDRSRDRNKREDRDRKDKRDREDHREEKKERVSDKKRGKSRERSEERNSHKRKHKHKSR